MGEHLERIFREGTSPPLRPHETFVDRWHEKPSNTVPCVDGFVMSVICGLGTGSIPGTLFNVDYDGPYTHVEVGMPSERPEPWEEWAEYVHYLNDDGDPKVAIYGQVPADMVRQLVELHGGEDADRVPARRFP